MGSRDEQEHGGAAYPGHDATSSSDLYSEESPGERDEGYSGGEHYTSDEQAHPLGQDRDVNYEDSGKKDALGILLRLAEALETDDAAQTDYYDDNEPDNSHLLGKPGKKGLDYETETLESYSSGGPKKGFVKRRAPAVEEDEEEEEGVYEALPFNADVEALDPDYDPKARFPLPSEVSPADVTYRRFKRQRRMNWTGLTVFVIYCICLLAYLFIRISKTMDLGSYLWYGVLVLMVECLGATSTLTYGINLLMEPVVETPPTDPENASLPKVTMQYHIRVLVPAYKESAELVIRTMSAAHDALLPAGCTRTLYLCDDGKDPQKRKWCQRMGPGVQYVSGRVRSPGEMNGKSANLNNCLNQIYPPGTIVPHSDVICIFDADQVANTDFFIKTLPLFDGGDDVGMVLSPQCFHNLRLHADVFNHANIHFWEYAQPGYDALGFISCTGTNFLCRATAMQEAGWSPEYTLTEDFAMGMVMKMNKWHCRYVQEYLAIGEAPEQVRNCFQQRSRWCKGHFQIVMSRKYCPLFQRKLSFGMKLLYCTGVWSYIVGAITTPTFIIIPLLTIWAGIFPIVLSIWAAIALTGYYIVQTLVLGYCKKWKHAEALWFSGVANSILWFTFVKACWRSMSSVLGNKITFKTTIKGMGKLADSVVGDLWMPMLCFILLVVSLGIGIHKLVDGPTLITTLAISVVWIIYTLIPPYLLLHYTFIGRGTTLAFMSRVMFVLSYVAAIGALALLWAVYPKDYNFGTATYNNIYFYDAQKVGYLPADSPVPWRSNALLYEASTKDGFPDLTGGWLNGGAVGDLKLTMPTAFVTTMLAWSLLAFPQGYESTGQTASMQAEVKWGTDYLLKVMKSNGHGCQTLVWQIGNLTQDVQFWGPPENMTEEAYPRPVFTVSTANGASDLAGQMVGAFVSTALVYQPINATYSAQLMTAADDLYKCAKEYPNKYTHSMTYDCLSPYAKSRIGKSSTAKPCASPTDYDGGSAAVFYNSTSFYDDLLWAAAWLYQATGESNYLTDVDTWFNAHNELESAEDAYMITDWDHIYWASNVLLANSTDLGAFHTAAQSVLQNWICATDGMIRYTPKGRAWNPYAPSTGALGNTALLALIYGQQPSSFVTPAMATRYTCFARTQMRYLLGDSGRSLMTGFGHDSPDHVQNRAASCPDITGCTQADALFVNSANPHVLYGAVPEFDSFSDVYQDVRTSNDSRVGIENNVGITGAMAGLQTASGTWEQCLQGYGVLSSDTAVCG